MAVIEQSSWKRTIYVSSESPVSGGLTVRELRDFVHALDEVATPGGTLVDAHHANDTRHLIRLSVHVVEDAGVAVG